MATQEQIEIRSQSNYRALENGLQPWRQPWIGTKNAGRPANVVSSNVYRGINPLCCRFINCDTVFVPDGTGHFANGTPRWQNYEEAR